MKSSFCGDTDELPDDEEAQALCDSVRGRVRELVELRARVEGGVATGADIPPPPPPDLNSYVSLSLKLMNWKFMDDSTVVTDETHLFTIKKRLEHRKASRHRFFVDFFYRMLDGFWGEENGLKLVSNKKRKIF